MSQQHQLSLPASLYLLAWNTDKGKLTSTDTIGYVVRAGALAELALRGLLTDADGWPAPVAGAPTGERALDELLELIAGSRPLAWKGWINQGVKPTLVAVREQLTDAGHLDSGSRRLGGLVPVPAEELRSAGTADELRERAVRALRAEGPGTEVSDRDAALVALAAAGGLRTVVSEAETRAYQQRLVALAGRGGPAFEALRRIVPELRETVEVAHAG
ncbi:GPP34 family phosphoprotein [Streptomyces sp. NPDC015131]|uniref:GOLPH3/VPS74 family protein n=1 Tax=Streptomyces sp. NPDC015131 TaxID=3364941 RepID=UPI003700094A